MKIMIEMEGNDPRLAAVIAVIQGTPIAASAPVTPIPPTSDKQPEKPLEEPKGNVEDIPVETPDAPAQEKTTAPSQASASAPEPKTGEVTLFHLQTLAAQLLQAGERRTLKSILDENQVKSLSTAPEDAYDMLFGALTDAVSGLAAS